MDRHVLVVVDRRPALPRAVAKAVGAEHFDVVPCTTSRGGLNACVALEPACVIAEVDDADHLAAEGGRDGAVDGRWLVRAIRSQPAPVSSTPIVLLVPSRELEERVLALYDGADCVLNRVVDASELAAQVRALVAMASRLRRRRVSTAPTALEPLPAAVAEAGKSAAPLREQTASTGLSVQDLPRGTRRPRGAMAGDLRQINITSVLTALELDHRSGELQLADPNGFGPLRIFLASGYVVGGYHGTCAIAPVETVTTALEWHGHRFEFLPGRDVPAPRHPTTVGQLVMSAMTSIGGGETNTGSSVSAEGLLAGPAQPTNAPRRRSSGTRRKVVMTPLDTVTLQSPPRRLLESIAPAAHDNRPSPNPAAPNPVEESTATADTDEMSTERCELETA